MPEALTATRLWTAALGRLQLQVTRPSFDTWLKGTVGLTFEGGELVVGTPTTFSAEWLEKRLHQLVTDAVAAISLQPVGVTFRVHQPHTVGEQVPPVTSTANAVTPASPPSPASSLRPGLNARYTFDTFVVGPSNHLAFAAAQAVADQPGQAYNPLFIYGGVGLGKTHLLQAIGHRLQAKDIRFHCVTTEHFTNEFITAIRERKTASFHEKYRTVDVLLIDDIQFISGKEQTQEGLFHTFNALHDANCQIVLTSDRPPSALPSLEDRLRSRFEWGLLADVQAPELETRQAILMAHAKRIGLQAPTEVIASVAERPIHSMRELEGSLNRVAAMANLTGVPVDLELIGRVLGPSPTAPSQKLTTATVIETVATYFQLTPKAMVSPRRDRQVAMARHIASFLLREELHSSLEAIGAALGGRNHATVMSSLKKMTSELARGTEYGTALTKIQQSLHSKPMSY
jgi:chromosomal replication initiator protein